MFFNGLGGYTNCFNIDYTIFWVKLRGRIKSKFSINYDLRYGKTRFFQLLLTWSRFHWSTNRSNYVSWPFYRAQQKLNRKSRKVVKFRVVLVAEFKNVISWAALVRFSQTKLHYIWKCLYFYTMPWTMLNSHIWVHFIQPKLLCNLRYEIA